MASLPKNDPEAKLYCSPGFSALSLVLILGFAAFESARTRSGRPLHLPADAAHDLDLPGGDAGPSEKASKLAQDPLGALGVEEADGREALLEVAHEPVDLLLRRRFRCGVLVLRVRRAHDRHQYCDSLREIEYREFGLGRDPDYEVTAVEILTSEAARLVAEDQGRAIEPSLDEHGDRRSGVEYRKPFPAAGGGGGGQGMVVLGRVGKVVPPPDLDACFRTARPLEDLRVIVIDPRPHELEPPHSEVGGNPQRGSEVSRQRGFHEDETAYSHRPI